MSLEVPSASTRRPKAATEVFISKMAAATAADVDDEDDEEEALCLAPFLRS